jgi:hypothetical protein
VKQKHKSVPLTSLRQFRADFERMRSQLAETPTGKRPFR